jgi:hypothetical protein
MVLFLLIAQGWRLTEEVAPKKDQLLVGGAVLVYCVCYTIIYTVDYALRDPASEVYVLLTTGAFFLVLIRLMYAARRTARERAAPARETAAPRRAAPPPPALTPRPCAIPRALVLLGAARRLFALCVLFFYDTTRREPAVEKQAFFRKAIAACAAWFLQLPIACFIALCANKWVRHHVATTWLTLINTATLAFLLWCFMPARARSYFTISATGAELDRLTVGDGDGAPVAQVERYAPLAEERDEPRRQVPDEGML